MDDDNVGEIIAGSDGNPDPGDWQGIYLNGYSSSNGIGEFDYCRVRYGGYYTGQADANVHFDQSDSGHFNNSISEYSSQRGLRTSSSPVVISSSSFNNNSDDGIYASSGELQIDNCQFNTNGNYAAYLINVGVKTLLKQFGQREFYRSIWFKWNSS